MRIASAALARSWLSIFVFDMPQDLEFAEFDREMERYRDELRERLIHLAMESAAERNALPKP